MKENEYYEIEINGSETIQMCTCCYQAPDAIAVSLSKFNDDYDIDCTNNGLNSISINRKKPKRTSWIIATISIALDYTGARFEFKQKGKIVTLNRGFKT